MGRIVDIAEIAAFTQERRDAGHRVVLTNGCFDLLHVGHVRLLDACREYGDCLIVGLNADASVTRLKGPSRPYVPADERAEILAALIPVDAVVVFQESTAERLANLVKPDVYVKGADYAAKGAAIDEGRLPEAKVVRAHGGEVVLLPLVPDRSSSALAERIRTGR